MQKGFAHLFVILLGILLIVGVVIGGSIYIKGKKQVVSPIIPTPQASFLPSTESNIKEYRNNNLGISFSYPKEFEIKEDTEEEYDKRNKGTFRKNFKGYIGWEPGKFLGAVGLIDAKTDLDKSPFLLWVFENPVNLSPEKWFDEYWYYPFVWGDFTERRKAITPVTDIQIRDQTGKYGVVSYRPDSPKFIYLPLNGKMYMFRILSNNEDLEKQILASFKFLNSNQINSFEDCQKAGYPVTKLYPGKCSTPDSRSFIQELSEEEKEGLKPPKDNLE